MTAKMTSIIYLQKDGFQFYSPLLPQLLAFHFVPEIVRDLDIYNGELFTQLVTLFIEKNQLPVSSVLIIIADNACFIKDFLTPTQQLAQTPSPQPQQMPVLTQEQREAITKFIDHVPFESVSSMQFPLPNGIKVLATNKDLYSVIKQVFETKGFTIDAVLPGLSFGNNASAASTIDVSTAATFLSQAHLVKQYAMETKAQSFVLAELQEKTQPHEEESQDIEQLAQSQGTQPTNKNRLYMLIGVFIFLIVLLIITLFSTQSTPPPAATRPTAGPSTANASTPQNTQTENAANLVTETTPVPPSPAEFQNLSLQIINASDSALPAESLRTTLAAYPFQSIASENQPIGVAKGVIVFSSLPSASVRSYIISEVKKYTGSVTVQQRNDAVVDVGIIIGK